MGVRIGLGSRRIGLSVDPRHVLRPAVIRVRLGVVTGLMIGIRRRVLNVCCSLVIGVPSSNAGL